MTKTWWDIILEHRPEFVKYPASLAKTTVLAAEGGDANAIQWMKAEQLWDYIPKNFYSNS